MSGNVVAHVAMLSTVTALPRSRVPAAPALPPSRVVAPIGRLPFPRRPARGRGAARVAAGRRRCKRHRGGGRRFGWGVSRFPDDRGARRPVGAERDPGISRRRLRGSSDAAAGAIRRTQPIRRPGTGESTRFSPAAGRAFDRCALPRRLRTSPRDAWGLFRRAGSLASRSATAAAPAGRAPRFAPSTPAPPAASDGVAKRH